MKAELYAVGGNILGVREYDSEEHMNADAWQHRWILFDRSGDIWRFAIRPDDPKVYKVYEKVE